MKVHLQLKQAQHLALTPQLQQSIRLLQLSTLDLDQELETFLRDNPLLERIDPGSEEATSPNSEELESAPSFTAEEGAPWKDDQPWAVEDQGSSHWQEGEDEPEHQFQAVNAPSLLDHLTTQLRLLTLNDRDCQLMALLLSHLDDAGYLSTSAEEMLAASPELGEVEPDELQVAISLLQSLEPAGVGARDLSECLQLQLLALPLETPARTSALAIVKDHLALLAARDHNRLRRALGIDEFELRLAHKLITQLDPKPGAAYHLSETRYVIPDVMVRKHNERWVVLLNRDAIPRLRINALYAGFMKKGLASANSALSGQLQEARWLIKNVQQRFETILRVSQAIVERQQGFFEHGEVAMRPLVLREIADILGLHESTISRVTTQKYMMTPRGLYELKYFFSSHVQTDSGGAASSTAIRALIRQFIAAENCQAPLSDNQISDILAKQGIQVARRTVAKYREALQIHPASQRKSL